MIGDVPTIKERVAQILEILGPGSKCFGNGWAMDFKNEKELHIFLSQLKSEEIISLGMLLIFFKVIMESVSVLLVEEEGKRRTLPEMFADMAWSNIAIAVMFSIVDKFTKEHAEPRVSFVDFLKNKFDEIKNVDSLEKLAAEHAAQHPPSMRARLIWFYSTFLTPEEVQRVVSCYRPSERDDLRINNLDDVIKDLYDKIRNGFLHAAGLDSIVTSTIVLKSSVIKNSTGHPVIQMHMNLTPSEILFLSWKAIFASLGYKGEITKAHPTK
ncbi:MAG: hypothetical protein JWO50_578 [Candidatus Kaiserbacteria bacterium]|nr:hypothetical protein [Candidatus Kaiserbacteria bacterium]